MKIAEYKQIDTKIETKVIYHEAEYDENGELIKEAYEEEIEIEIPVMGTVYRYMTEEEIAEMSKIVEIPIEEQLRQLKKEISSYDYIGVKIAMGVATREEYAEEIAYTETLREKIRELEEK